MPRSQQSFPLIAICLLVMLVQPATVAGQTLAAATPNATVDAYRDIVPDLRAETIAETANAINRYQIDVALNADVRTLSGTLRATFVNTTTVSLPEVYFRLFPNAAYYGDGALTIDAVEIAGQPAAWSLEVVETALRVDLPKPVDPGRSATVDMNFTTVVPVNSEGSFGIFSYDRRDGTWILADWHPVLAVFEEGRGWRIDPPTSFGDPTFAASALYEVQLALAESLTVVTSGVEVAESRQEDLVTRQFTAGPAREFTLVIDDDYQSLSADANGTTVTIFTGPAEAGSETAIARERTLAVAVEALAVYGDRFGPYPYVELDLVETRLIDAFAVSWGGIIFLDGSTLLGEYAANNPAGSATVIAHEVAHLWWGAAIGSNSNDHTFVNEGLATLSSMVFQEERGDGEVVAAEFETWVVAPSRLLLGRGDTIVDEPLREGQDPTLRAWAFYAKAALAFSALRQEIGDEAFFAALRAYADRYQHQIAEPDDLRQAFETASGRDLEAFWTSWFEATDLTVEQIDAVAGAA